MHSFLIFLVLFTVRRAASDGDEPIEPDSSGIMPNVLGDCSKFRLFNQIGSRVKTSAPAACGQANTVESRIVNGQEAASHKYPWMALLLNMHRHQSCGGALISNKNILTAAHCIY